MQAGAGRTAAADIPGDRRPHADATPSISSSSSTRGCSARSATSSAWKPASTRRRRRWRAAKGSCRDSSWLLVQIAAQSRLRRALRLRLSDPAEARSRRRSTARPAPTIDFTDLHAWCEVYLPGAGWIGFDPTSGLLTGESHIPLAATPHYRNAAPISGMASFANVDFDFDMKVTRVAEHPRITKPFSDESWARAQRARPQGRRRARSRTTCA